MATSEQAILADSFPPAKPGQAFAIYGIAVVVAPVIGPTLGGWMLAMIGVAMIPIAASLKNIDLSAPARRH